MFADSELPVHNMIQSATAPLLVKITYCNIIGWDLSDIFLLLFCQSHDVIHCGAHIRFFLFKVQLLARNKQ